MPPWSHCGTTVAPAPKNPPLFLGWCHHEVTTQSLWHQGRKGTFLSQFGRQSCPSPAIKLLETPIPLNFFQNHRIPFRRVLVKQSQVEVVMIQITGAEAGQLVVGAMLGLALSINMTNHGFSISNPETRWQSLSLIGCFLFTFIVLTDLLISPPL